MKVSIYITNFNYGNFLENSIRSALDQNFNKNDYEIIIIDDNSTDQSKEILKKYININNIKIIFNNKTKGLIKNINIAIKASRGQYVIRLDSDDYLHKNALKYLYNVAKKDAEIGIVYSDFYKVDLNKNIISREKKINLLKDKIKILNTAPHGACCLVKKNFLIETGLYDEKFDRQDGYYLWYNFLRKYKIKNINKPLFYYRQHKNSLSSNLKKILNTRSKIIDKLNVKNKLTYAFIPVRGKKYDENCLSVKKIKKKNIIDYTIDSALQSKKISKIIISSGDYKLLKIIQKKYKNKILYHLRDNELSYQNTSYMKLLPLAIKQCSKISPDTVVILNIESPFRETHYIDQAINNQHFNNCDRTVCVLPEDSGHYYKYSKNGLKLISNTNYNMLKLEKKYIFAECGGIEVINYNKFINKKKLVKIGHIVMDKKSGFMIKDDFDFKYAKKI